MRYPACNGNCSQGRESCDCDPEFPEANGRTALIAVVVVAIAAALSSIFPMGVL